VITNIATRVPKWNPLDQFPSVIPVLALQGYSQAVRWLGFGVFSGSGRNRASIEAKTMFHSTDTDLADFYRFDSDGRRVSVTSKRLRRDYEQTVSISGVPWAFLN
jgi:hypothetical protein